MPSELLTITDAAAALRAGDVSATELVAHANAVSDAVDGAVGAYLTRFREESLVAAKAVDAQIAAGDEVGPLAGIPIGVKDIISTVEGPTTAQSLVHSPTAIQGDAVVIQRLRHAGGVMMGKLTTMEFAVGSPDPTKPFPIPKTPWNAAHWTGGSSSGSGNAVATGAVLGALGTDTGGSIRIPSAFCGITGLMPTYGRVPKSGCVPLGFTTDHIGPMVRSAKDAALMLSVMAGHHPSDVTSIDEPLGDYLGGLTGDLSGVRIGVDTLASHLPVDVDPALAGALDAAAAALRDRGAEIVEVELPLYQELSLVAIILMFAEALAYHTPDLQTKWSDYFAATRTSVATGALFSAADYVQAQRVRQVAVTQLAKLYQQVDLVLTPTLGVAAPSAGDFSNPAFMTDLIPMMCTPYWDPAGNPVLALPMGFNAHGLPLSFQLAGRPFEEALVLRAGDAYQQETDWHLAVPPLVGELLAVA